MQHDKEERSERQRIREEIGHPMDQRSTSGKDLLQRLNTQFSDSLDRPVEKMLSKIGIKLCQDVSNQLSQSIDSHSMHNIKPEVDLPEPMGLQRAIST